jgi:hypothetical protein
VILKKIFFRRRVPDFCVIKLGIWVSAILIATSVNLWDSRSSNWVIYLLWKLKTWPQFDNESPRPAHQILWHALDVWSMSHGTSHDIWFCHNDLVILAMISCCAIYELVVHMISIDDQQRIGRPNSSTGLSEKLFDGSFKITREH